LPLGQDGIGLIPGLEGMHQHIDRGYVYFAMAFALVVELVLLRMEHNFRMKQANKTNDSHQQGKSHSGLPAKKL
jgi:predicted tellurium resistance membrane protein TerC